MADFLEVSEGQFKSCWGSYKYSTGSRGACFVVLSWGTRGRHHIRIDLQPFADGRWKKLIGNDYRFQVVEFHVKMDAGREEDADRADYDKDFDYLAFAYGAGDIWTPTWGKHQEGQGPNRSARNSNLNDNEWGETTQVARDFLRDLGKQIGKPQMVRMNDVVQNA